MGGYHALMHLVKDQLVDPCEPRTINSAIASTGVDTYLPIGRSVDHDHGEVPSTSTTSVNIPVAQVVQGMGVEFSPTAEASTGPPPPPGSGNGKGKQGLVEP